MGIMMRKDGNKSIIWTQWDYIMVETAISLCKRFPKQQVWLKITILATRTMEYQPKPRLQGYSVFQTMVGGIFPYPNMGYA
jgi:hypothetical protein